MERTKDLSQQGIPRKDPLLVRVRCPDCGSILKLVSIPSDDHRKPGHRVPKDSQMTIYGSCPNGGEGGHKRKYYEIS